MMRRGFQIWEWIALVFLGLVLAAIFFPVYACACGEAAPTVICVSNVKQLTLGHLMYAADWNDHLPPSTAWMDATRPYIRSDVIFHHPKTDPPLGLSKDGYGYSFNSDLAWQNTEKIAKPDRTPILFDSVNYARNAADPLLSLPMPGRHKGRNVMGFVDGHAKPIATLPSGLH